MQVDVHELEQQKVWEGFKLKEDYVKSKRKYNVQLLMQTSALACYSRETFYLASYFLDAYISLLQNKQLTCPSVAHLILPCLSLAIKTTKSYYFYNCHLVNDQKCIIEYCKRLGIESSKGLTINSINCQEKEICRLLDFQLHIETPVAKLAQLFLLHKISNPHLWTWSMQCVDALLIHNASNNEYLLPTLLAQAAFDVQLGIDIHILKSRYENNASQQLSYRLFVQQLCTYLVPHIETFLFEPDGWNLVRNQSKDKNDYVVDHQRQPFYLPCHLLPPSEIKSLATEKSLNPYCLHDTI